MRDRLTCDEVLDALQRELDGVAPPYDPDRNAHLDRCGECRERFEAARLLLRAYPAVAPAGFVERVTVAVRSDRRQRTLRRALVAVVALAACLLIAIQFGGTNPPPEPSGGERFAETKSTLFGWTQQTVNAMPNTDDWTVAVTPELGSTFEPAAATLGDAGKGLAFGLEPLTESAKRALAKFRRDLPVGD